MDDLTQHVAGRFLADSLTNRRAAELSARWFKNQRDRLRSILKEPLKDGPEYWGFVLHDRVVPFFKQFQQEFEAIIGQDQARESIQNRVQMARTYVDGLAEKLDLAGRMHRGTVDFSDAASTLRWQAILAIHEKMQTQAKVVEDLFKRFWVIDPLVIDRLVQKTMKAASPEELDSIRGSSNYRAKFELLSRVKFEANALKALTKNTLDSFDPTKWVDRMYEMLQANYSDRALQETGAFREFDLHGMKVVVDDRTVDSSDIQKYVRYLKEAHAKLKAKGFAKAWYGTVFIRCKECGGVNPNTGGGTGGWFEIGPDTVTIFNRPGAFIVELMAHELGHRYWFKQMRAEQRAQFSDLVKVHTAPRPTNPINVRMVKDRDIIEGARNQVLRAQDRAEQRLERVRKYDLAHITPLAQHGVGQDGWAFTDDIISAMESLDVDKDLGPEVAGLKDDVYKTRAKLTEHFNGFSLVHSEGHQEWLDEAKQLIDQIAAEALIFIDFATQRHNERAREKLKADPATLAWVDSLENNPAPVPAVSTYGASDIDEAFAEVFAHYVMGYDMTRDQMESFQAVLKTASIEDRVAARFAGGVVPLRKGPTITIGGRHYVLSDYWPALGLNDDNDEESSGGARLIKTPGGPRFSWLWAYDTDRKLLSMWRVSDGENKHDEPARSAAALIVQLDRKGQLNRVTHAEFQAIERFMDQQYNSAMKAMKQTIEENADEWDRTAKRLAQELFDTKFVPRLKAKMREVEQGVIPLGFKVNDRILEHRSAEEQAKMFVTNKILEDFTLDAVNAYVASKGFDTENPPGDFQATHWARFEVLEGFYEDTFKKL